ncbi:hypothetical protein HPP92_017896 [Vanilla planifolia]|uniref:Uncharacterized protein n=1 Tax=Vanilla planifolia TaxID=51239 RepID=A0A835UNX3_VANPL|nr:hypothetical protein HPP92_017896 [Vanilla planifolia]
MPNGFRLLMLLSTPFPLRPSAAVRFVGHYRQPLAALSSSAASYGRLFSEVSSSKIVCLVRPAEKFHTQAVVNEGHSDVVSPSSASKNSHAWLEWSKLVDHLLAKINSQRRVSPGDEEESFLIDAELPEAFLKATEACLVFAKERPDVLRLLTKKM